MAHRNKGCGLCQDQKLAQIRPGSYKGEVSQISVILPTFNRKDVLERALESVARQTFQDWELIVVDDGSTDRSAEFFSEWKQRRNLIEKVKFLRTPNAGVSRARNLAVNQASSPWLAFLDSDDEWLPEKLSEQFKLAGKFLLIHSEEIWIRNGVRVNPMKKHVKSGGRVFSRSVDLCFISPSTVMMNRELFLSSGGFREDFPVCEDYEMWLRMSSRHEVGYLPTALTVKYGGHADQLSLQFHSMDLFRVRALLPFLSDENISAAERFYVAEAIVAKSAILLAGYEKHGNLIHKEEVVAARQRALSCFTQLHSTNSVTERLPL